MTKPKTPRKIEAQTAGPMQLAPPPDRQAAREHLLDVLYALALEGNVTAAKLYLDFSKDDRDAEPSGLTAEEALELLRQTK